MKKHILFAILLLSITVKLSAQTYTTTTPVTGLSYPVAFTFTPDGRILVTQKAGLIKIFQNDGTALGTFYSLTDSTYNNFERGLLGIEVDPDFATNHYVYAYYVHLYPSNASPSTQQLRVVRFTESNNVGTNPTVIFRVSPGAINGNHVGGNIRFRPSDPNRLYIGIGEIAVPSNAQLLNRPYGKFLRINKDGTIPADNPFYDDGNPATGNDDRIWSYGHRNPFDFCFSPVNDSLYCNENGQDTWDEQNIVTQGKNYGWNACEGYYTNGSTTTLCTNPAYTNPIQTWAAPLPAVTGVCVYTGCLMPELTNHLISADNDNGYLYNTTLGNAPAYDVVTSRVLLMDITDHLTTVKQGADGYIYALQGGYVANGKLFKFGPSTPPVSPTATFTYPNTACINQEAVITYTGTGTANDTYVWQFINGNETQTDSGQGPIIFVPNDTGTYSVKLVVSNGCQTDSATLVDVITVDPAIQVTVTVADITDVPGSFTLDITNGVAPYTVSYTFASAITDTVITGTQFYNPDANPGEYYFTITDANGCSYSDSLFVNIVESLFETTIKPVKIFPNPTSGSLFIDLKGMSSQAFTAQVYNGMGALVMSTPVNAQALAEVNVAALPTGMYYLMFRGDKAIYSAKWTKQ